MTLGTTRWRAHLGHLDLVTIARARGTRQYAVDMLTSRAHFRRLVAGSGLGIVLAVVLCGCLPSDPAPPTGVRLNRNGTVDFVSCMPFSEVTKIEGTTYRRHGWNGTIDDKTKVDLKADTPAIHSLAIGQIVTFSGIPAKWASMYLHVADAGHNGTEAAIQNGDLHVGIWTWQGELNPSKCLAGKSSF
jgi:hypothetical protein